MTDLLTSDGFALVWHGQLYRLISQDDHVRKDGRPTKLRTWRSLCPDCGVDFVVRTGLVFKDPNRRCPECKAPGRKV